MTVPNCAASALLTETGSSSWAIIIVSAVSPIRCGVTSVAPAAGFAGSMQSTEGRIIAVT